MPVPSPAERREMLVDTALLSDAFTVSKGEKTQNMLADEADKAASSAQQNMNAGKPVLLPKTTPPPDPAPPPVLEKLAGVLKFFIGKDAVLEAATKIRFKEHFSGVLTQGVLVLEPLCDSIFDAATPGDVTFKELRSLGMHRGGASLGIETLGNWVKSTTYSACMPNGELADDYLCAEKLIEMDETLVGGKIEWNEMDAAITINREPIEDALTTGKIRIAIGSTYSVPASGRRGMRRFVPSEANTRQALESIARANKYHPARDWLNNLEAWDGTDYYEILLKAIGGWRSEANLDGEALIWTQKANALALVQIRRTFIGSAARIFKPGCQMDTVLVLKSKQGTKKSSLFAALAPAGRFSATHFEFGSKDSRMNFMKFAWLELAELSNLSKRDVNTVKSEITIRYDDFRLPYGSVVTSNPRTCIFVGSTNDDTFLKDPTGSRRWWIIPVDDNKKTDIMFVEKIAPQLWAQTVAIFKSSGACADCMAAADGEVHCPVHRWWLSVEEDEFREKFNEQYTEQEPYVEALQQWLTNAISDKKAGKQGLHAATKNTDALRVHELLEVVGNLTGKDCHDPGQQRRMCYALKKCGYVKKHTKGGNFWISPGMQGRPELHIVEQETEEVVKNDKTPLEPLDPLKTAK